jgi:hypothetical protein
MNKGNNHTLGEDFRKEGQKGVLGKKYVNKIKSSELYGHTYVIEQIHTDPAPRLDSSTGYRLNGTIDIKYTHSKETKRATIVSHRRDVLSTRAHSGLLERMRWHEGKGLMYQID